MTASAPDSPLVADPGLRRDAPPAPNDRRPIGPVDLLHAPAPAAGPAAGEARAAIARALADSEAFARSLLDASPDCVKTLDPAGRLLTMNGRGRCLMEIDDFARLAGSDWPALWRRGGAEARARDAVAVARDGGRGRFQAFCPTARGTARWWDVIVSPIVDADGRVRRLLAVSRDVTEAALREQREATLRRVLEQVAAGVPRAEVLAEVCRFGERHLPGSRCAVLLFAPSPGGATTVEVGAAPSCEAWARALDGLPVDEVLGVASAACLRGETVDGVEPAPAPAWVPVRGTGGTVLGCLALHGSVSTADAQARRDGVAHLAAVAIERWRAEAAVAATARRYAAAVDAVAEIVWTNDAQGRMVGDQPDWTAFTGQSAEACRGHGWADAVHPDDAGPTVAAWQAAVAQGRPFEFEHRVRRHDGVWRAFAIRAVPVLDDDGTVVEWVGTHRDVTDEREARRELARREALLRAVFERAPVGMGRVSLHDARWLDVNDAFARMVGRPRGALVGHPWSAITHPHDVASDGDALRRLDADAPDGHTVEKRFVHADGQVVWARLAVSRVRDAAGRPDYAIAVIEDITERRRATEVLQASEERLRALFDAAPVPVFLVDPASQSLVDFNDLAAEHLGYPREAMRRLTVHDFDARLSPQELAATAVRAEASRERQRFETLHRRRDGELRAVLLTLQPIVLQQRLLVYASAVDITDLKRAEQALVDADRRKDEFLATLAHELRNPLAPIRHALEILGLTDDAVIAARARAMMDRQLSQLVRLVDDLLDVSRITRGKLVLMLQVTDVARIVDLAVETARPAIAARGHRLVVEPVPPTLAVRADPVRLAQVLTNLLHNAAKYTPAGGTVTVSVRPAPGERVRIAVHDTGIGLAAASLPRVFDLFAQVDPGTDQAQGGLGIGLALARRLAGMHGGTLDAASPGPGRGATFTLELPLAAGRGQSTPAASTGVAPSSVVSTDGASPTR